MAEPERWSVPPLAVRYMMALSTGVAPSDMKGTAAVHVNAHAFAKAAKNSAQTRLDLAGGRRRRGRRAGARSVVETTLT